MIRACRSGAPPVAGGSPGSLRPAVSGAADGAEELVAGSLDGLGGVEGGGGGGELVERLEGDVGLEEPLGVGSRAEAFVGRGDVPLAVASPDAPVGAEDLGGEEAGAVEVEEGAEGAVEEGR